MGGDWRISHWNLFVSLSILLQLTDLSAPPPQWATGYNNKPAEEDNLVRADFARLFTNVGVAAMLLTGITICLAQGYRGFLALEDAAVPALEDAAVPAFVELQPSSRHSLDTAADEPASYPAAHQLAPATFAAIKASAGSPLKHDERRSVRAAVWRHQQPAHPPQIAPSALYRARLPAAGWPRVQPPVTAPWQPPSYTPRTSVRPSAVRSGFGTFFGPRLGGKACMGFG